MEGENFLLLYYSLRCAQRVQNPTANHLYVFSPVSFESLQGKCHLRSITHMESLLDELKAAFRISEITQSFDHTENFAIICSQSLPPQAMTALWWKSLEYQSVECRDEEYAWQVTTFHCSSDGALKDSGMYAVDSRIYRWKEDKLTTEIQSLSLRTQNCNVRFHAMRISYAPTISSANDRLPRKGDLRKLVPTGPLILYSDD